MFILLQNEKPQTLQEECAQIEHNNDQTTSKGIDPLEQTCQIQGQWDRSNHQVVASSLVSCSGNSEGLACGTLDWPRPTGH